MQTEGDTSSKVGICSTSSGRHHAEPFPSRVIAEEDSPTTIFLSKTDPIENLHVSRQSNAGVARPSMVS